MQHLTSFNIVLLFSSIFFLTNCTSAQQNNLSKDSPQSPVFSEPVYPEFIRVEAQLIKKDDLNACNSNACSIQLRITKIIGRGATFSSQLQSGDTIIALLKFGVYTIATAEAFQAINDAQSFMADIEGNPIIPDQFTIYKFQTLN